MQKTYTSQLQFTISGNNSEQIQQRLEDFKVWLTREEDGVSNVSIYDTLQTDGDDIEETTGLTVEDVIKSCAETNRIITDEEAHEILRQYNQGCIDNPGCSWFIVVEVLADNIIDNRGN